MEYIFSRSDTKMKLKRLGFFRELSYGSPGDPSIHEKRDDFPVDASEILIYLNKAHLLVVSPEVEYDVISQEKLAICSLNILTDGYWAWPQSLSYYFEHYKVILPIEFLEGVRSQKYVPPFLSEDELARLELSE
jgi:hypothetical protein